MAEIADKNIARGEIEKPYVQITCKVMLNPPSPVKVGSYMMPDPAVHV